MERFIHFWFKMTPYRSHSDPATKSQRKFQPLLLHIEILRFSDALPAPQILPLPSAKQIVYGRIAPSRLGMCLWVTHFRHTDGVKFIFTGSQFLQFTKKMFVTCQVPPIKPSLRKTILRKSDP